MYKKPAKILFSILLILGAISIFSINSTPAKASLNVRVGVYDNPPKVYMDSSGVWQGFFPDIVNAIGKREGWNIQYVNGTFQEGLNRLVAGKIDIMVDVALSTERQVLYDFNDETAFVSWGQLYARKDVKIESLYDLEGKKMAILESGIHYTSPAGIRGIAESFGIKIDYINANEYDDVFKLMDEGKADVGAVSRTFGIAEAGTHNAFPTNIVFNPVELHFAFTKGSAISKTLITEIDLNLKEMKADANSIYYASIKKHLKGAVEKITLTPVWVTALTWIIPSAIFIALIIFFIQIRYQRLLRKAINKKTAELIESEFTYKSLFESSKDTIIVCDSNGLIIDCNKATLMLFKISTVEEFLKRHLFDLSPDQQPNSKNSDGLMNEIIKNTLEDESQKYDWVYKKSDNTLFDAEVLTSKSKVKGKDVLKITIRDISEKKLAEKKLKELGELKDIFIRVISHQLRTPMNVVRWNLEILLDGEMGKLTDSQEDFVRATYQAEVDVINRVGELLTALDIEEGRVAISKEIVSLDSLCASTVGALKNNFQIKGIAFNYAPPSEDLPPMAIDADKIRNVFEYLIENALDYTHEGGTVSAKLLKVNNSIRFEIIDSGVGIPKAEQPRIFGKFFRASNATTMVTDRTGVGLAICKYFVELHKGAIGFESEEGKGSTFWFELPITQEL